MKKAQTPRKALAPGIARVLKRLHYPLDVMLLSPKGTSFGACVRWYVAYSLSLRNLEEMMAEHLLDRGGLRDSCVGHQNSQTASHNSLHAPGQPVRAVRRAQVGRNALG